MGYARASVQRVGHKTLIATVTCGMKWRVIAKSPGLARVFGNGKFRVGAIARKHVALVIAWNVAFFLFLV